MMTKIIASSGALAVAALIAGSAWAGTTEIDISAFANADLSTYYNGYVYPANGGQQTIAGVGFDLIALPGGGTGIVQGADGNADTYTLPIGLAGVTTVYTVMNSAFGETPYTIGSLVFTGSGGATYTYSLTEGDNIRDHATTYFNDSAPNIYGTKDYGSGDHLDVQKIVLPSSFAGQTLTSVTFNSADQGEGDSFLAAITVSSGAVPEPATWAMLVLGVGLVGLAARHRPTPGRAKTGDLSTVSSLER
jgi:hypothetical protein